MADGGNYHGIPMEDIQPVVDAGVTGGGGDAGVTAPGGDAGVTGPGGDAGVTEPGSDAGVTRSGGDAVETTSSNQLKPNACLTDFRNYVSNNKLFSGCVVLDAVLIITILGVTAAWFNFAKNVIVDFDPNPSSLYCMKCENLDSKLKEKKDTYFTINGEDCCAGKEGEYLPDILNKYVQKTVNETYTEKPLFQLCLNSTTSEQPKAYAQIAAISSTQYIDKINLHLVKWDRTAITNQTNPLAPFFNKIRYADGTFKVERAGYYHIYSRLVFNLKMDPLPGKSLGVVRHLILKYRKDYNVGEKLLEGYATQCEVVANTKYSSMIFGDFFLQDTDKVQVLANDPVIDAKMSYFGMYLI